MSSRPSAERTCKHCGGPLSADGEGAVCHACLMQEGLQSLGEEDGPDTALPTMTNSQDALERHTGKDPLEGSTVGPGGRYKILQRLGEGGFGVVYMADQTDPVRRRVALKVLKAGMDTRQVVARFEAERQALAVMDHPNIAKVLDGGETEQGRPFFVMELVRGTPITTYCDREQLDAKARLRLFTKVCRAVQHAHQKGIIHRDLKPSNILVTVEEGAEPVPKVIDFGVAKALESNLTDKTLFTRFEQMIGTPAYMSPEQAGTDSASDVDTRADIYALGVLLYELLTGTTPFEANTLQKAAFEEVRRILREEDAPRPSARLSSLESERRTTIAKERGTEAGGLGKLLRGDLDWIVMKAIEKDRRRRYETANALAVDVERHLADEPVRAGPPTARYRTAKFMQRHKAALAVATAVALSLIIGLGVAVIGFAEASKESAIARQAQKELATEAATLRTVNKRLLSNLFTQLNRQGAITQHELTRETVLQAAQILEAQDGDRDGLDQVAAKIKQHLAESNLDAIDSENLRCVLAEIHLYADRPAEAASWLEPTVERLIDQKGFNKSMRHRSVVLLAEALIAHRGHISALNRLTQLQISSTDLPEAKQADARLQETLVRGTLYAADRAGRRSNWPVARRHFDRAYQTRRKELNIFALQAYAAVLLHQGDHESYQGASAYVLQQFSNSTKSVELAVAAKTHFLVPRDICAAETQLAFEVAGKAYDMNPYFWNAFVWGMANYRVGNFKQAIAPLSAAELNDWAGDCNVTSAAFLSMVAARTGNLALAADHLARAKRSYEKLHSTRTKQQRFLTSAYPDQLISKLSIMEAQETLQHCHAVVPAISAILLPPGSEWRWLASAEGIDPRDADSDFHRTFFRADYDDSNWELGSDSEGPHGGFGFGEEGFEGVDLGTPAVKGLSKSAYFRHRFTTDREYTNLELRCQRDDGIIVYLDGCEVARSNMPDGHEDYELPARRAVSGVVETTVVPVPLQNIDLPPGKHILAISLHNTQTPSSDLRIGEISLVAVETEESEESAVGE